LYRDVLPTREIEAIESLQVNLKGIGWPKPNALNWTEIPNAREQDTTTNRTNGRSGQTISLPTVLHYNDMLVVRYNLSL